MSHCDRLTTTTIREAFAEEISAVGGTVTEAFDDGRRLFARSVLARSCAVLPDDRLRHGVALRTTGGDVLVHPYIFRQVCSNGAILAQSLQSSRIKEVDLMAPDEAESSIRKAVCACCAPESFASAVEGMRSAHGTRADIALTLLPLLSQLSSRDDSARLIMDIMERFTEDADSSRFGLLNAVTSVARDTRDPETRWRLEEFGGAIALSRFPNPDLDGGRVKRLAKDMQLIAS